MEHISPKENDLFEKALRLLYGRRLEQMGLQGDVIVTRKPRKKPDPGTAA